MFRFFNANAPAFQGTQHNPQWSYVRAGLQRNLATVKAFYNNSSMAVSSQHFLLKILLHYGVGSQIDIREFYQYVASSSLNLSMALKMTSSIYTGRVFEGTFYGPGVSEVLIAYNDPIDPVAAYQNWMHLTPIKVLYQPTSDLAIPILNGVNRSGTEGMAVIAINIPELVLMYRGFRDNEARQALEYASNERSVMQFVHMFVLPSMCASHLDLAVFNRFAAKVFGRANHKGSVKHSFYLPDYSSQVDGLQAEQVKFLTTRRYSFASVLESIKVISAPSMYEASVYPDIFASRQVAWGLVAAAVPVLEVLLHYEQASGVRANQVIINQIQRRLKFYRSDQLIESALNRSQAQALNARLRVIEDFT